MCMLTTRRLKGQLIQLVDFMWIQKQHYQLNMFANTTPTILCIAIIPTSVPSPPHTPALRPSPTLCTVGHEWPSTNRSRIQLSLAAEDRMGCLMGWRYCWERRQAPRDQCVWLRRDDDNMYIMKFNSYCKDCMSFNKCTCLSRHMPLSLNAYTYKNLRVLM